jgi:sialic acid synthase SpsE
VGYSDHTLGIEVSIAAVTMGAVYIEKHFTLDQSLPGPDHKASLNPQEFKRLVTAIRHVQESLGDGIKRPAVSEIPMRELVRKSVVAAVDISSGTVITPTMLTIKRPGTGISPGQIHHVYGLTTLRTIQQDQVLSWEDFRIQHG